MIVKTVQLHDSGFCNGCKKLLAGACFKRESLFEKEKNVKLNGQLPDIKKKPCSATVMGCSVLSCRHCSIHRSVAAPLKQSRK